MKTPVFVMPVIHWNNLVKVKKIDLIPSKKSFLRRLEEATLAKLRNSQAADKFLAIVTYSFYICSVAAISAEIVEPILDLLNRGVSVAGIAARECPTV